MRHGSQEDSAVMCVGKVRKPEIHARFKKRKRKRLHDDDKRQDGLPRPLLNLSNSGGALSSMYGSKNGINSSVEVYASQAW